ncbi:MAG: PfkB family carbohydrate kinase [Flavobacteriales bacterium]|nr:PfkB family carbohydrate kinase [Flavobacteriales bacterium]
MSIQIIGGTYREIDFDGKPHDIFGSGLRAAKFVLENSKTKVRLHTAGNSEVKEHLQQYTSIYKNFEFDIHNSDQILTFKYYFSLDEPRILPDPRTIKKIPLLSVSCDNLICYGMLDGEYKTDCQKVVYDPQTSLNPVLFSKCGKAEELIYVVNNTESKSISNCETEHDMLEFFFDKELVKALIVKNGPYGAKLYTSKDKFENIPSYRTNNVSKIGSGDVFTSAFAYFWFNQQESLLQCAINASKATANYCDMDTYSIKALDDFQFSALAFQEGVLASKQVYIAGPMFSLSDVILVDKIREVLLGFGVKVFSPYHDIGYGNEREIAEADLKGIEESDIVFTVLDGLDSGTLIELGHLIKTGKKIIGYHRTVEKKSLLMLETANIEYFQDLTTALYHVIWNL